MHSAFFDFAVLAHVDVNLFLYGTFGFWSAFLNVNHSPMYTPKWYKGARVTVEQVNNIMDALDEDVEGRFHLL